MVPMQRLFSDNNFFTLELFSSSHLILDAEKYASTISPVDFLIYDLSEDLRFSQ